MPSGAYSIVVHGGAWAIPSGKTVANLAGVRAAARKGHAVLARGGTALDAVEAAVKALEDDPSFAAGTGSCLTAAGTVELDAAVMYAPPGAPTVAGGVAAVTCAPRNAVTLARRVAECSEHVLLCGRGADAFAASQRIETVDAKALVTAEARAEWEEYNRYGQVVTDLFSGHDTVGAAALDSNGGLAAATSTGGITYKRPGRVGDSPIVGAGLLADADVGACSATGHGESILLATLSARCLWFMEQDGMLPSVAARKAVDYMKSKTGGCGGLVAVDKNGNVGFAFNTVRMVWASIDSTGAETAGIDPS